MWWSIKQHRMEGSISTECAVNMMWTAHIEGGPMRVNHAAVSIGVKIYSFGGYCSTEEYKDWQPIPVHVLDTNTMRWTNLNYKSYGDCVPFERYGHSAVAYGDKIYLWGGRNNAVQCDILACFDTKTLEWSNPPVTGQVPFAKDGHTACLIRNRMYIFAGFEYHTDQYSQDLHYLDLNTMEWKCVIPEGGVIPSHRDFHSATAIGDRMYVYGGRGDLNSPYNSQEEVYCPQLCYFDTIEEKWVMVSANGIWPDTRRSHSAWVYNECLYIFGGYNGLKKKHFNDIWRYSIKDNLWSYLCVNGTYPSERRRQACIMHGTKMFMFGGTSPQKPEQQTLDCTEEPTNKAESLIDNSDMHILDFSTSLRTMAICAVVKYKLDFRSLPWNIELDIKMLTVPNRISFRREKNPTG